MIIKPNLIQCANKDYDPLLIYSQSLDSNTQLKFSYLTDSKEYLNLLHLRYDAYSKANKISKNYGPLDLSDFFDCKSKIILAKINDSLVGSIRVTFLNKGDPDFSYQYVSDLPNIPALNDIAEASRLCTAFSVRRMGIAAKLEALMVLTAINEGRNYILGSASGSMIDFHVKYGFKRLGIIYINKDLADIPHELMILDCSAVSKGIGINQNVWKDIYLPAIKSFQHIFT